MILWFPHVRKSRLRGARILGNVHDAEIVLGSDSDKKLRWLVQDRLILQFIKQQTEIQGRGQRPFFGSFTPSLTKSRQYLSGTREERAKRRERREDVTLLDDLRPPHPCTLAWN